LPYGTTRGVIRLIRERYARSGTRGNRRGAAVDLQGCCRRVEAERRRATATTSTNAATRAANCTGDYDVARCIKLKNRIARIGLDIALRGSRVDLHNRLGLRAGHAGEQERKQDVTVLTHLQNSHAVNRVMICETSLRSC